MKFEEIAYRAAISAILAPFFDLRILRKGANVRSHRQISGRVVGNNDFNASED
jgi:hypothetical protein